MAAVRRRASTVTALVAASVAAVTGATFAASPATAAEPPHERSAALSGVESRTVVADPLTDETGLALTIDSVRPAALREGQPLRLVGQVTNIGDIHWRNAKVYLDIEAEPVTTKDGLAAINTSEDPFGTRIIEIGLFDEIGNVPPGTTKSYQLRVPFADLQISGAPGVYQAGASLLAETRDGRDLDADARAATVVPLLPEDMDELPPAEIVTVVPVAAPVIRHASGNFLDDRLAQSLSTGGALRNLVEFLGSAPPDSVEIVVDPALLDAVRDMTDGYLVTTRAQEPVKGSGREGSGQVVAQSWLDEFDAAAARQDVLLMAWGSPDSSALARGHLPGIIESAVRASKEYAESNGLTGRIVNWQNDGASTRRGLVVSRSAGAVIQMAADDTFVKLAPQEGTAYLPSLVSVASARGPLTAAVASAELAGERLTTTTRVLDFRQNLMAEATIRSLEQSTDPPIALVALPFGWDPGGRADTINLDQAYSFPAIEPVDLQVATQVEPAAYQGPIRVTLAKSQLSDELVDAIALMRSTTRTLMDVYTDEADRAIAFDRHVALSATSLWVSQPQRRLALTRSQARAASAQLRKLTVTGPTFVALSSQSGQFPLTVTNGLDESVTVHVNVRPQNPALRIDPIDEIVLEPGQSRDIEVSTESDSSGVTPVRVRLATVDDRVFGAPWEFDVRATQIGVAIWVVMGVGGAVLVGTAVLRLFRRVRSGGLHPREKPSP